MRYRILCAFIGLMLLATGVVVAQGGFLQTFDGTPATPQPYPAVPGLAAWDVVVHSRNNDTLYQLEPMEAVHGPQCQGPPATHHTGGNYAEAVFQCANHVMTAIQAGGYGLIYLTPPVVADWTDQPAVIQWDMSTLKTSGRDWVDLWVTPFGENMAAPLDAWLPALSGTPPNTVHLRMDGQVFRPSIFRNFVQEDPESRWWAGYETWLTPDAARRDTFQLTLSRTHIKFGMPAYNQFWVDADMADLGWTQGVIQLGHHDYNPLKDCPEGQVCAPNTWHWDNVSVNPALPFTITRANEPYKDTNTSSTVTFPAPALDGSHLRFWGIGSAYELSLDGGATWAPLPPQPSSTSHPEHGLSYWAAVPGGTQRIDVRAQGGWWGPPPWLARDFALWSQVQVPPGQRTPTPTVGVPATRTATPTSPPTLTPGPTPTDLPTPTLPPLPTVTPLTNPTATITPGPRCARTDIINGGLVTTPLDPSLCFQQ